MEEVGVTLSTVFVILFASSFLVCSSCLEICSASTQNSNKRCETLLDFCVNTKKDLSDVRISGNHNLDTSCIFNGTQNLTLKGQSATIECSPHQDSGFVFYKVSTLMISDIVFVGCGANWTTNESALDGLYPEVQAALVFDGGHNHILKNVTVLNATSAGIHIYNVAGKVTVDSCRIQNASSHSLNPLSGNIIGFDYNITGSATLTITNSTFTNNGYRNIYKGKCSTYGIFSYSSGLAMFFGSPLVTAEIKNNNFSQNIGCNGGNMAVLFFNNSAVTISNTSFIYGTARYGGGLYMSIENSFLDRKSKEDKSSISRVLSISNSRFFNNRAQFEGGGVYMQWKQSLILNGSAEMEVTDSTFGGNALGNRASGGLAFHYKTYLDTSDDPYSFPLFHVTLNITNCNFSYHFPNISSSQLQSESSVVIAVNVPYLGISGITVESNNCTGILAIASTLVFYNNTALRNNTALTGGGIRLCSSSTIYLTPYTSLIITNNSVQQTGGGMQVYSNCLISKPACFYQYSRIFTQDSNSTFLSTVNFTVENNQALEGGDNIYGGLLDNCYFLYVKKEDNQFRYHINVPNNTIDQPSSISSDPQHVCFNYSQDSGNDFKCNRTANARIYPGEQITLPIRVVGQSFGTVSGAVLVAYSNGTVTENNETAQAVRIPGENITYTIYSSQQNGFTDKTAIISLTAGLHSDTSVHEYSEQYLPAIIFIRFKKCPFGFNISNSQSSQYNCTCPSLSRFKTTCSIQHQVIEKPTSHSWIGVFKYKNKSYLASSKHCPFDYCNTDVKYIKSHAHYLSQDKQCQYNRTGTLCGSCPKGWSLVLGTSECKRNCSNLWLFLILPFSLAGLLFVALIHFLNLTVTMGTICGLIFYANVVQTFSATLFSDRIAGLTLLLEIFLSWLNLDLGIQVCFYRGMSAFGKAMLSFVFPVYIWLISITIVILSNKFIFFTRLIGENSLKVLATLLLLSFSKMLRVINNILNVSILKVYLSSNEILQRARWILDGNVPYTHYKHLILVGLAVLMALLVIPFMVSLLCIRHVFFLSRCKTLFMWLSKLKPFFDTYTGPYKDNATFWTGLLLLIRLFLLTIAIYVGPDLAHVVIITVSLVLATSMIILQGVYKRHLNNVLEAFFILNIGIIFTAQVKNGKAQWIVPHVMITLAFIVFLGIIAYHIYLKYSGSKWASKTPFMRRQVSFDVASVEGMRGYDDRDESTEEENFVEASDRLVHFPPVDNINYDYERSNSIGKKS